MALLILLIHKIGTFFESTYVTVIKKDKQNFFGRDKMCFLTRKGTQMINSEFFSNMTHSREKTFNINEVIVYRRRFIILFKRGCEKSRIFRHSALKSGFFINRFRQKVKLLIRAFNWRKQLLSINHF